jgi:hypothetical protein
MVRLARMGASQLGGFILLLEVIFPGTICKSGPIASIELGKTSSQSHATLCVVKGGPCPYLVREIL